VHADWPKTFTVISITVKLRDLFIVGWLYMFFFQFWLKLWFWLHL